MVTEIVRQLALVSVALCTLHVATWTSSNWQDSRSALIVESGQRISI